MVVQVSPHPEFLERCWKLMLTTRFPVLRYCELNRRMQLTGGCGSGIQALRKSIEASARNSDS